MPPGKLRPDPMARLDGLNGHDLQTTIRMLRMIFFDYGWKDRGSCKAHVTRLSGQDTEMGSVFNCGNRHLLFVLHGFLLLRGFFSGFFIEKKNLLFAFIFKEGRMGGTRGPPFSLGIFSAHCVLTLLA